MDNIKIFIAKEKILLMLLFVMLLNPFFYGYRIAILFVFIIFFQNKKYLANFDSNVYLLFLFAASYEIIGSMRIDTDVTMLSIIPNIFIPCLLYLVGKRISSIYSLENIRIFFLFFISFSLSVIPLISIIIQIANGGFELSNRSMYLIWDKNTEINATGLASYFSLNLASIGLLNLSTRTSVQKKINIAILILFILSVICVIRLGSRTQLGIVLLSFLVSYLLSFSRGYFFKKLFIIFLAISISVFIFISLSKMPEVSILFQRGDATDSGIGTAGGRSMRWIGSFNSIFTDPWGWKFSRYGYAHNLWLDVARVAGVIPLVFLIFISFASFKLYIKSFKILKDSHYLKVYISLILLSIFLGFNVEPVMEGMYLLFLVFCIITGFLSGIVKAKL